MNKFNIGEEVYILAFDRVVKTKIVAIELVGFFNQTTSEAINYVVEHAKGTRKSEERIFRTKEELIASL